VSSSKIVLTRANKLVFIALLATPAIYLLLLYLISVRAHGGSGNADQAISIMELLFLVYIGQCIYLYALWIPRFINPAKNDAKMLFPRLLVGFTMAITIGIYGLIFGVLQLAATGTIDWFIPVLCAAIAICHGLFLYFVKFDMSGKRAAEKI